MRCKSIVIMEQWAAPKPLQEWFKSHIDDGSSRLDRGIEENHRAAADGDDLDSSCLPLSVSSAVFTKSTLFFSLPVSLMTLTIRGGITRDVEFIKCGTSLC